MRVNCDFDSAGCFFRITFAGENCAPWYFRVILNECEVSHVCLLRFLHCVLEMTKLCFPVVIPTERSDEESLFAVFEISHICSK